MAQSPQRQRNNRTPAVKQFSFSGGEISPRLFGRTDLQRYAQSVQTMRNFLVEQTGCATNRPGTMYVREVKDSSTLAILIPFTALNGQAYALEFGVNYMRVHTLGGTVTYPTTGSGTHTAADNQSSMTDATKFWQVNQWQNGTITNETKSESATITSNTQNTIVGTLSGSADWDTDDEYSLALSSPGLFQLLTPFTEDMLRTIKYAQQNDVMVLVHPDLRPQVLSRLDESDWRINGLSTARNVERPTIVSVAGSTHATAPQKDYGFVVTAIDRNGQESLPSEPLFAASARFADSSAGNVIFNPSSNGNFPAGYNIYVTPGEVAGAEGNEAYGFIGFREHVGASQTDQQTWWETLAAIDYSDGPPTQRDPFTYVAASQLPGAGDSQVFTGSSPFWSVSDAEQRIGFLDQYTYQMNIQLQPGEWVEFNLEAKGDDVDAWVIYDQRRVENTGTELLFLTAEYTEIIVDPNGNGTFNNIWKRFGVRLTDSSATVQNFNPLKMYWTTVSSSESTIDTFPSAVCFYEQRLVFAGFTHNQQLMRFSRTGDLFNFDQSVPLRADDSFDLVVASLRLDAIRQLVPGRALLTLTTGAEWLARGIEGGALTPSSFDLKLQTAYGASELVQALPVGDTILYVTERGRRLRELLIDPYGQQERSRDLSVMVEHMFRRYQLMEMQYADQPYQVLWMVREDGTLMGLTYVKEHNVFAWHRHDTGGVRSDGAPRDEFESVCAIPEGDESSVYVIVKRQIDGAAVRYVELFASRHFVEQPDGVFLDSALTFDGRNTGATQLRLQSITGTHDGGTHATTLTDSTASWAANEWAGNTIKNTTDVSEGTAQSNTDDDIVLDDLTGGTDDQWENGDAYEIEPTWVAQEKMILHADTASTFVAGDVGTEFELRLQVVSGLTVTDYSVRVLVTVFIDGQNVEVTPNTTVPSQLRTVYTSDWGQAFNDFSGLDHLEGETIGVLVDGSTHDDVTVSSGAITLDSGIYAERLQAGIKYTSDIVTMPLDFQGDQGTLRTAKKLISKVFLEVDAYRGLWAGHSLDHLREVQQRSVEEAYATISPENILVRVLPASRWSRSANVAIRQVDPLPVSVLSVIAGFEIGGN